MSVMNTGRLSDEVKENFSQWLVKLFRKIGQMFLEEARMYVKKHPEWKTHDRLVNQAGHVKDDLMWIMVTLRRAGYIFRIGDESRWYRHAVTNKGMRELPTWLELGQVYCFVRDHKHLVGKKGGNLTDDQEAFLRYIYHNCTLKIKKDRIILKF